MSTENYLNRKFPIKSLGKLDFGSADGHRDKLIDDTFVETQSIRAFMRDDHSIVVGPFGAGKSALFELLKKKSPLLGPTFGKQLILPIEEKVHFHELGAIIRKIFGNDADEESVYQMVWKFHAAVRISSGLAAYEGFPADKDEKLVNKFLKSIDSTDANETIVDKLSRLASSVALQIDTKIGDTPYRFQTKITNKVDDVGAYDLDAVLNSANRIVEKRGIFRLTIIIDKIDKFVAGQNYLTQKKYIQGLLEVEDDFCRFENLHFKIFLREDLFTRLDFSVLGPDKVSDNTLQLKWSAEESLRFIAGRISTALSNEKICTANDMVRSSDLSDYNLSRKEKIEFTYGFPRWVFRVFNLFNQDVSQNSVIASGREIGLFNKYDRVIITKVFPRHISHITNNGDVEEIDIFEFLTTHFIDGNGVCTPRYLLIFLKEVRDQADDYYEQNQDIDCSIECVDGDYEWPLFKKRSVEKAYKEAKAKYLKNITAIDSKWRTHIETIIQKKANKTVFALPWIKSQIGNLDDETGVQLMAFLRVVGFFEQYEDHLDLEKRKYTLPILYKS